MAKWLNFDEFKTYYYNTARYSDKERLLNDFSVEWNKSMSHPFRGIDISILKKLFNADNKKSLKIKLQGKGYTPAGIDGLYRCISNWIKANS